MASPLISAHRAGHDHEVTPDLMDAISAAVALGVDLIEIDVRVRADGTPAVGHDSVGEASPTMAAAIARLGPRTLLHLDLKESDPDARIVDEAVTRLGSDRVIVTTAVDSDVPRILAWARTHAPGLLVGLSTSKKPTSHRASSAIARVSSWFPRVRMRRSGANLVVAHHLVARWWLARWAARRNLPLLVWTVDQDADLRRWLHDPRATIITTNRPARALQLRN